MWTILDIVFVCFVSNRCIDSRPIDSRSDVSLVVLAGWYLPGILRRRINYRTRRIGVWAACRRCTHVDDDDCCRLCSGFDCPLYLCVRDCVLFVDAIFVRGFENDAIAWLVNEKLRLHGLWEGVVYVMWCVWVWPSLCRSHAVRSLMNVFHNSSSASSSYNVCIYWL